ncbi:Protein PHYTOCHROME KINASE SUBSTRATE 3 [Abeliophyllum distichum]|uniref:Protein PHYTOCHROME KINASE SUBSTRATE 3 n=1 Tax=Abeliophyllum distichum TaxID=126358 RepID=A0ABD1NWY8_9LAMI
MATEDNTSLRVASFSCYLDTAKENMAHMSANDAKKLPVGTNSQDSLTSLRVDAFSYLNTAVENFVFKVPGLIQDAAPAFSFHQETPCPITLERTKYKDDEIGVFGADNYFKVKLDRVRAEPPVGSRNPSVCSQESSWSSQNASLQNTCRIETQTRQKKRFVRRFFAGLCCQGPCFNKKSFHINEIVAPGTISESKPTRTGSKRVDHFTFPIPNTGAENLTVEEESKEEKLDEPRRSLEVFSLGSSSVKGDVARNLERKLSMLTWDAFPKSGQNLTISTPANTTICDDMASDASSDLFEIENISGTAYSKLKLESDQDHMSSCMSPSPTMQYAPSEASIEWSVVTASAADYSSVISDYDEKKVSVARERISMDGTQKTSKTRNSGGLLGCKNEKAASYVAETANETSEKAKHQIKLDLSV